MIRPTLPSQYELDISLSNGMEEGSSYERIAFSMRTCIEMQGRLLFKNQGQNGRVPLDCASRLGLIYSNAGHGAVNADLPYLEIQSLKSVEKYGYCDH